MWALSRPGNEARIDVDGNPVTEFLPAVCKVISHSVKLLPVFCLKRLLFPSILRIVVYGRLTGAQVPFRGAVYMTQHIINESIN